MHVAPEILHQNHVNKKRQIDEESAEWLPLRFV